MIAAAAALVLLAGIAIGITGVGGVLVVPSLTLLGGVDLAQAVAATSTAFLFPGLQAWWQTVGAGRVGVGRPGAGRPGAGRRAAVATAAGNPAAAPGTGSDAPLALCAFAGSLVGAWAIGIVDPVLMRLAVGVVAVIAGLHAWFDAGRRARDPVADGSAPRTAGLAGRDRGVGLACALGLAVGAGSALSGTGGPVLLLPVLMLWRVPLSAAILSARRIQLPVALAAAIVHVAAGRLDWRLMATLAVLLLVGGAIGHRLAARLPVTRLTRGMGVLLVMTGVWFLAAGLRPDGSGG